MIRRSLILLALLFGSATASVGQTRAADPSRQTTEAHGTTVVPADMYYLRDTNRNAIRRLPAGTELRVIGREGSWLLVIYTDDRFGNETGYVQASTVRLDDDAERFSGTGKLAQRGFIEGRGQFFGQKTPQDDTQAVGDALWREEAQLKPAPWLQFSAGFDLRANSHREVEDEWRLDLEDRGIQRPRASLRRLAATVSAGAFSLDVGKQFVRWGKADILNPTDRFAPRDYLNVTDSQFLPIWAARGSLQLGEENIEAVYQPQFTPSRLPLLDQRWTVLPAEVAGLPIDDRGSEYPDRSSQGVRWNHVGSSFEMSLSAFDGINHLADVAGGVSAEGAVEFSRRYPRLRTFGGDLAIPTPWFTLKGEAAAFRAPDGDSDEYVIYVIELERQIGEWLLDGGYAGEVVNTDRGQVSFSAERGVARSIIGHVGYTLGPRRSLVMEGVARQDGAGGYIKGEYSHGFAQHWRATFSAVGIRGDLDDFLGRYQRNSSASATLRFSF